MEATVNSRVPIACSARLTPFFRVRSVLRHARVYNPMEVLNLAILACISWAR